MKTLVHCAFALLVLSSPAGATVIDKSIQKLIDEQKFEAAATAIDAARKEALQAGRESDYTELLVKEAQLRMALGGYETAVRFLKQAPWPKGFINRTAVELYYAQALTAYVDIYSWEIRQRERVEAKGELDLKVWTSEQIIGEALKTYNEIWQHRAELSQAPVGTLKNYIEANSYPAQIRGTLRDALTYLTVDLLANTTYWHAGQANDTYRLDFAALVRGAEVPKLDLADAKLHPLEKIAAVLSDVEAWHTREGHREAALEARLERLRRLASSFTADKEHEALLLDLRTHLDKTRDLSWWAMGEALLAGWTREWQGDAVKARELAIAGQVAYPKTVGGERCHYIQKSIEAPELEMQTMRTDAASKRSIEVEYRNLSHAYFRAYALDLSERLDKAHDYALMPDYSDLRAIVEKGHPVASWSAALPDPHDYKTHRAFPLPPALKPGLYVIATSAHENFSFVKNRVTAAPLIISNLAVAMRNDAGTLDGTVVDATSGQPVPGVNVQLYEFNWSKHHQRVDSDKSDKEGRVHFSQRGKKGSYFIVAERGDDRYLDPSMLSFWNGGSAADVSTAMVYTDRAIYRPNQKVLFKIIAYRGTPAKGQYQVAPGNAVKVSLRDGNNQEVASLEVKTNEFGSAAGEFLIPAGRLLGAWTVITDRGGMASVRVEEYKRPTFEVALHAPKGDARIARPVTVSGDAKYYFGLPVTNGAAKWRITREPIYPYWWGWYFWTPPAAPQNVASGTSVLAADGTFAITFTPQASDADKKLSFNYRISCDFTDEGGETRSASLAVRIGFVNVEADISLAPRFFREGDDVTAALSRHDLNGSPRAGNGNFTLITLLAPPHALAPADIPSEPSGEKHFTATPDDALRPRWDSSFEVEREIARWKDGTAIHAGALAHDTSGRAVAVLGRLPAGAYRIRYETADDLGTHYETFKDFVVVSATSALPVAAALWAQEGSYTVGSTARLFVRSGFADATRFVDFYRDGKVIDRRQLRPQDSSIIEWPVREEDRGGLSVTLWVVHDHQTLSESADIYVPWDNKQLDVSFSTFRDKLTPGASEKFAISVRGVTTPAQKVAAEVLAYMYDRSLDAFAQAYPPQILSLYPSRARANPARVSFAQSASSTIDDGSFVSLPNNPDYRADTLITQDGYGIGGLGARGFGSGGGGKSRGGPGGIARSMAMPPPSMSPPAPMKKEAESERMSDGAVAVQSDKAALPPPPPPAAQANVPAVPLRTNFSETAFFAPQLRTAADGSASVEFTVPDSVTSWRVWAHAVTPDLRGGSVSMETRSVKDLMVRPYLPRFLREGDKAELKVVVNNASDKTLSGELILDIEDADTHESVAKKFGLEGAVHRAFNAPAGGSATIVVALKAPADLGVVALRVTAKSGALSDGELRPLPILPSRMHLTQSRFVTLRDKDSRTLRFEALAKDDDPTRINEQMVVSVDAQLFFTVLKALPYLINYPYECIEQTLNRFVSTGIVSSLFAQYPQLATMAAEFAKRKTVLEPFDQMDPNRKMSLEESPWLVRARGGDVPENNLLNVLNPAVAKANRDSSLTKLTKAQLGTGAFPWFPGSPPSPFMTMYVLHALARAVEFKVEVPRPMIQRAWQYMAQHYRSEWRDLVLHKTYGWESITFLNFIASSYPDDYTQNAFTKEERAEMLAFSFKHWKEHSPYLKAYLALTLERAGRATDAKLVFASVMDSAQTAPDQGTFWAQEDRSWLWYNDTIETHAFALRTLMEVDPANEKKDGLVLWLLLNKKLNQWKSTRATAEVIYSLAKYMQKDGSLGVAEAAHVSVGTHQETFAFSPDKYEGKKQLVLAPAEIGPKTAEVTVSKESKGVMFASATWSFSTDKLPDTGDSDFFSVTRSYFKREQNTGGNTLRPLIDGEAVAVGDQIEVHLSLRTKHEAEYVHLRDPRAAGLEPEAATSGYRWQTGVGYYEEVRDSGANYFFEQLPVGEYPFKYRLRANVAGTFRIGPATVESMYAPEFHAYSAGNVMQIVPAK